MANQGTFLGLRIGERPKEAPYKQGYYPVRHPQKYIGETKVAVYRSSWELVVHKILDNNPNIVRWRSEPFFIPYVKPTDKKVHRYFPDYYVEARQKDGTVKKIVIEVKPEKDANISMAKIRRIRLAENLTYAVNRAKWLYADKWCKARGIEFMVLTERELFAWRTQKK